MKCKYINGCSKRANFGFEDNKSERYCSTHKEIGMEDIVDKKCIFKDENGKQCKTRPNYGKLEDKSPSYCSKHKLDGMEDIIHIKCIFKDENGNQCKTIPYFGKIDDKTPTYCGKHKLDGMENIKSPKCIHIDKNGNQCKIQPNYGKIGDKNASYCFKHKLDGMEDIKNPKCIFKDKDGVQCKTQPNFGIPTDKRPSYCYEHKLDGMENIVSKTCIHIDKNGNQCKIQPSYGLKNDKNPTYCSSHKLENMEDIKSKRCESCNLYIVSHGRKLCSYCNPNSTKAQKTKEMEILKLLQETYKDKEIVHNKSIGFECGNFRPDFIIDCGSHNLIIEVDEDQHKTYPKDCEETRLHRIAEALNPCIIIRYNPDAYKVDGITKKTFKKTRHEKLLETVNKYIEVNVKDYLFEVVYLFYDDFKINRHV